MEPSERLREQLLARVPPPSRVLSARSQLLPLELGALLGAASKSKRSLLAFAPPLSVLATASAGIFRAAREREACVVLRIDLAGTEGRGCAAILDGIAQACGSARYQWPLGLVADLAITRETLANGEAGRDVGAALGAGFPTVLLTVTLPLDASAVAELLTSSTEHELGICLALAAGSVEPESFLMDLRDEGVPLAAMVGDRDLALVARAYRWATGEKALKASLLEEVPPVLEVDLRLPDSARRERSEALAYFAAEAELVSWRSEHSGPAICEALLAAPLAAGDPSA